MIVRMIERGSKCERYPNFGSIAIIACSSKLDAARLALGGGAGGHLVYPG